MRPAIVFIHEILDNCPLVGAEIGVAAGDHAREILECLDIKKLYLIDIWESYLQNGVAVDCYFNYYEAVVDEFSHYRNVEILREYSTFAASKVPDELDFVYIDGNHEYEAVKEDILHWYPKIRIGGILSGHDYYTQWPGIIEAVNEFVDMHNCNLYKAIDRPIASAEYHLVNNNCDWWIVKK